jgi:hypothetical protein
VVQLEAAPPEAVQFEVAQQFEAVPPIVGERSFDGEERL